MPVSRVYSATNPAALSCALASIAQSRAIDIERAGSARAGLAAIGVQMHQPAANAFGSVSDIGAPHGTKGMLSVPDHGCRPWQIAPLVHSMTKGSSGLIAVQHALLRRSQPLAFRSKRVSSNLMVNRDALRSWR